MAAETQTSASVAVKNKGKVLHRPILDPEKGSHLFLPFSSWCKNDTVVVEVSRERDGHQV